MTARQDPMAALDLAGRLALRPREAAAALGLSERKLRGVLRQIPHVRLDGTVLIPVDLLRRWLEEQSRVAMSAEDATVSDVLRSLADKASEAG